MLTFGIKDEKEHYFNTILIPFYKTTCKFRDFFFFNMIAHDFVCPNESKLKVKVKIQSERFPVPMNRDLERV